MFTGIIEDLGLITGIERHGSNIDIWVECSFISELKVDQSVSLNGVCLTVVELAGDAYKASAVAESLAKSNLSELNIGSQVNLERAMKLGDRLDGHLVQGHVDGTATCTYIEEQEGSWKLSFSLTEFDHGPLIEKGSICLNGVSLTLVDVSGSEFSVAIIPHTYKRTNFSKADLGDSLNVEFDMIGKYVAKLIPALD